MSNLVANGAALKCSQGLSPAILAIVPAAMVTSGVAAMATINDHLAMTNIGSFGMCKSMANPEVAAATAAAQGTLAPQPCTPVTTLPWSPGAPGVKVGEHRALTMDSTCGCAWAGQIEITQAGSNNVETS